MGIKSIPGNLLLMAALCCSCARKGENPSGNSQHPASEQGKHMVAPGAQFPAQPAGKNDILGLPLIETNSSSMRLGYMALLITGEGGWEDADRALTRSLAASGVPVIALDWSRYFAGRPTTEEAAASLGKVLTHYHSVWNQEKAIAIGRSAGADVLPFLLNLLPDSLLAQIEVAVLIEPGSKSGYPFAINDGTAGESARSSLTFRAEIEKLRARTLYCFYQTQPGKKICRNLDPKRILIRAMKTGNSPAVPYDAIGQEIVRKIRQ